MRKPTWNVRSTPDRISESPPPSYIVSVWRELADLNRQFLALVADRRCTASNLLSATSHEAILRLSSEALDRIAQIPCALFRLELFQDEKLRVSGMHDRSASECHFVLATLMSIWYGMRSHPQIVPAVFDLNEASRQALT